MQVICIMRSTKTRSAILAFLQKEDIPVDVSEISDFLRSKNFDTNLVTIYRVLEAFYKNGIVDRLEFGEGKFRYEIKDEDHHHLICEHCGSIEDISDCSIPKLEQEIQKKKHFKVTRHSLEFFGICYNCQR